MREPFSIGVPPCDTLFRDSYFGWTIGDFLVKSIAIACTLAVGCALGAGNAGADREGVDRASVTSVTAFVQAWQQRILDQDLAVPDARTWARRNLPKFARFSADRLELAKRATTLDELESLLVTAPIAHGTSLAVLMETQPGDISLDALATHAPAASIGKPGAMVRKFDPGGLPSSYGELLFTALNPCRIFDSRVSQGGAGPFMNGVSRQVKIGPFSAAGGGYATGAGAQGGSATGCGVGALAATADIAAVMLAVSSFSQTSAGYLTFYSNTGADPSATVVSMFYTAGPVQTAFVVVPTDLIPPVSARGVSRSANTEVTLDIVGYFAKAHATALDCVIVTGADTIVPANSLGTNAAAPLCASSYTNVASYCVTSDYAVKLAGWTGPDLANNCNFTNATASPITVHHDVRCCRVPGR